MKDEKFFSFPRAIILTTLKENPNSSMEDLFEKTGVSRGALKHHLTLLSQRGLITISERKRGKENRGSPVKINITNKATPLQRKTLDKFEAISKLFKK